MDIKYLKSFIKIAELGSYTAAAAHLNYAQSTLNNQVKSLERELGYPLFDVINNKIYLTNEGVKLLDYAYRAVDHEIDFFNSINQESVGKHKISIGAVESIMSSFVIDAVGEFLKIHPEVNIFLDQDIAGNLFQSLKENKLDIIITMGDPIVSENIAVIGHKKVQAKFFSRKDHPLLQQETVRLSDILQEKLVLTGNNSYVKNRFDEIARKSKIKYNSNIRSNWASVVMSLVKKDQYVALLPEYLIYPILDDSDIVILDVDDFNLEFYLQICHHKGKSLYPLHKELVDLIKLKWMENEQLVR